MTSISKLKPAICRQCEIHFLCKKNAAYCSNACRVASARANNAAMYQPKSVLGRITELEALIAAGGPKYNQVRYGDGA